MQPVCDNLKDDLKTVGSEDLRKKIESTAQRVVAGATLPQPGDKMSQLIDALERALNPVQQAHLYHLASMITNAYAWCSGEDSPPNQFPESLSLLVCAASKCVYV